MKFATMYQFLWL